MTEWIDIKDHLPTKDWKYKVKTDQDEELYCYFYLDSISWIAFYGLKTCHWWNCRTKEAVYNVTHWKGLKDDR